MTPAEGNRKRNIKLQLTKRCPFVADKIGTRKNHFQTVEQCHYKLGNHTNYHRRNQIY
jgi:hypothetical protein